LKIDSLIHASWIIQVDPDNRVLHDHVLAIRDGRILDILPSAEANTKYRAVVEHHLPEHALIPGLINAHTHAAMCLLRGLADDMPLMKWLHQYIWPAESRWISEEFVRDGSLLAIAEMLRGGTTCFNDMYFYPEITGRVAATAGIRATLGLILVDFPSAWAQNADEYLRKGIEVHDEFRHHPLIRTAFAPHAPYSVSDAPLERVRIMTDELQIPIHMHVHETHDEVLQSLHQYGQRPLERLADLGLLSPALIAVHMTQMLEEEIQDYARSGGHIVHAPESNLKLASGFARIQQKVDAGINVALGTDGAASNNDLDMLGEMRTAAFVAKGFGHNPSLLPASMVLRMATINGARALGIEEETGSLEIGKSADVVALDLGQPETQPVYHPVSQILYAAGRHQVRHVWIAGQHLLNKGVLTSLDLPEILARARLWRSRIAPDRP